MMLKVFKEEKKDMEEIMSPTATVRFRRGKIKKRSFELEMKKYFKKIGIVLYFISRVYGLNLLCRSRIDFFN